MGLNPKFKRAVHAKRRAEKLRSDDGGSQPQERYADVPPSPEPSPNDPEQRRADLALRWLNGYKVQRNDGLLEQRYPTGDEEKECRAAMAELLFNENVTPDVLWMLAAHIAPDDDENALADRRLEFVQRNRGAIANASNDLKIAFLVRSEIEKGTSESEALETAAAYFRKSVRRVKTAWYQHKRTLLTAREIGEGE